MRMTVLDTTNLQSSAPKAMSSLVRGARLLYYATTVVMLGSVALQVFFAGAALLVDSSFLEAHRGFAHVIELLALVLPVTALLARQPWRITLLSLAPFFLVGTQYVYLYALTGMGLPLWTRGLHAVNALVIYWLMLRLSRKAWLLWHAPAR